MQMKGNELKSKLSLQVTFLGGGAQTETDREMPFGPEIRAAPQIFDS
jgi:hypothetical protein